MFLHHPTPLLSRRFFPIVDSSPYESMARAGTSSTGSMPGDPAPTQKRAAVSRDPFFR
jgi:hypothetical protein